MRLIFLLFSIVLIASCDLFSPAPEIPSVPILYMDFNGDPSSSGIEKYRIFGNQKLTYSNGISDSCLNLSISSHYRKPVIINTKGDIMLDHQDHFAVMIWVKMKKHDLEKYGIIGNKALDDPNEKGWILSSTEKGAWRFEINDGTNLWHYEATPYRQKINDGIWHQIGFHLDKGKKVAHTYFDGKKVGTINLLGLKTFEADQHLHIGCAPGARDYSMNTFNGFIDEVGIWSKKLNNQDFADAYSHIKKEKLPKQNYADETFKLLTWNIWNGGKQFGKTAGLEQIAEILKTSGADIISLQEEFGSGEFIADKLGFYFYRCSKNICLLSRFQIGLTHQIYKPLNSGGAQIMLTEEESIIVCPIWLSHQPNIKGLLANPEASTDTILKIETESRANEAKFIMSELRRLHSNPVTNTIVLAGDFNSGSHLDWTEQNKAQKYNKAIPFPSTRLMEENGFKDAYREIWTDETKDAGNTYSPIFKEGFNDRIDFILYKGNAIKAIDATVIDSASTFFPSDHAAVLITFKRNLE